MKTFDYVKPELVDFVASDVKGASCYVDCTTDAVCPTPADKI